MPAPGYERLKKTQFCLDLNRRGPGGIDPFVYLFFGKCHFIPGRLYKVVE